MTGYGWRLTICTTVFPHPITFLTRLMFNLVRVGKKWASPVFPHPRTSNFRFYAYSWQGNVGWVFPHPINHMHNSFPRLITFCIRLIFNLIRLGKEWAGPVFPHPLKSKGYMCIDDRVRLAVLFCRRLTVCTTVFPHPITFWTRLMFNLVRVGKEWVGPVFPYPLTSNFRFYAYSWQGKVGWVFPHLINHMHNSFPPPDNLLNKVDVKPCQGGERMGRPRFSPPQE